MPRHEERCDGMEGFRRHRYGLRSAPGAQLEKWQVDGDGRSEKEDEKRARETRIAAARGRNRHAVSSGSRFQLVAGSMTHVENINGVVADGENDAVLVLPPAVEPFADF